MCLSGFRLVVEDDCATDGVWKHQSTVKSNEPYGPRGKVI
jgi:hypothetical protein